MSSEVLRISGVSEVKRGRNTRVDKSWKGEVVWKWDVDAVKVNFQDFASFEHFQECLIKSFKAS